MHHQRVHPVRFGEGLEAALEGHGQGKLVHEVHGGARHNGPAAQFLQAENCGKPKETDERRHEWHARATLKKKKKNFYNNVERSQSLDNF